MKNKIKNFLSTLRFIKYGSNNIINKKDKVSISDNFNLGIDFLIITSFNYRRDLKTPYDEATLDKDIIVEDNVCPRDRAIILGETYILERTIIPTGSIVVKDIEKKIKIHNKEHFYQLKKEGKFY